jgi:hypothetical protein
MRVVRAALLAVAMMCAAVVLSRPAGATSGPVVLSATVNGTDVASSSATHPVRLRPAEPATVNLTVRNDGVNAVAVHRVELSGRVLGLTYFSFSTSVDLSVAAGATETLNYSLDLAGLGGQATGLMGGSVVLFDDQSHRIARSAVVTDVRGSIFSVYGVFGFTLVLLTILALLDVALSIARHRMPVNRWRRGLRTATPGIGIGLVLVFTLSALRVWVPNAGRSLLCAGGFAAAFFLIGYLTPTPTGPDDDVDAEPLDDDVAVTEIDAVPGAQQ